MTPKNIKPAASYEITRMFGLTGINAEVKESTLRVDRERDVVDVVTLAATERAAKRAAKAELADSPLGRRRMRVENVEFQRKYNPVLKEYVVSVETR